MRIVAEFVFRYRGQLAISIRREGGVPEMGDRLVDPEWREGAGPWTIVGAAVVRKGTGQEGDNVVLVLSGKGEPEEGEELEVASVK